MLAVKTYALGSMRVVDEDGIPCIVLSGILTAATIRESKAHVFDKAADDPVLISDWSRAVIADTPAALVSALDDWKHVMRQPVALVIAPEQEPAVSEYARLMAARRLSRPVFLSRKDAAAWCRRELAVRLAEARYQAQTCR